LSPFLETGKGGYQVLGFGKQILDLVGIVGVACGIPQILVKIVEVSKWIRPVLVVFRIHWTFCFLFCGQPINGMWLVEQHAE
jgi:hypothetical protein